MGDADKSKFVIATRQVADLLWSSAALLGIPTPPATLATKAFSVREVDGYSAIAFLGIADQSFQIRVQEASTPVGPWTQTALLASSLDAVLGVQKVVTRIAPTGLFMRIFVDNLSATAMKLFSLSVLGIPEGSAPGSTTTGGGGGGGTGGGGTGLNGAVPNRVTFAVNQRNVAVPGTAVALQPQAVPDGFSIFLRAKVDNTGTIWVGPDAATAQNHAVATPLEPGATLFLWLTNTSAIFIDAEVAGEGVSWTVEI